MNTIDGLGLLFSWEVQAQEVTTFARVFANGGISVDENYNLLVAHFEPLPNDPTIGKSIWKVAPDGTTFYL